MTKRRTLLAVSALLLPIAATVSIGRAHGTGFLLAGIGTATLDGILSPGEWTLAGTATFNANAPAFDGGGTLPVTMYVMNDAATLYLAFQLPRNAGQGVNPSIFFDGNHDTVREAGDDEFGGSFGQFGTGTFVDAHVFDSATLNSRRDTEDGGTNDGAIAGSTTAASTVVEMSHPLASGDAAHDFTLSAGDTIGFGGVMNLFSTDITCTPNEIGGQCQAFTDFTGGRFHPLGDITILEVTTGSCHAAAAEARRIFVEACVAAGGSRPSCNAAGNEIMRRRMASCP